VTTSETAGPRPSRRPGFSAGFGGVFSGFGFLVRTPKAWPFALVPALILVALAALLSWGGVTLARSAIEGWVGSPESWYGRAGASVLSWLGAILAAIMGLLIAMAITPPLSAPALEHLVSLQEKELGVPARTSIGILNEIWCGIRAQAFAAMFAVPILGLLWVIELLFAPAAFVTVPLKFLVSALCLAWNLFDYPLTLWGVRMRERFGLIMKYKRATFGFGLAFALLFWLPCCGILMLPVGAAAATRLIWRLLEHDAELLPDLPRPAA
jgi:uncharacterized protein involved in cysteine biosynthesis